VHLDHTRYGCNLRARQRRGDECIASPSFDRVDRGNHSYDGSRFLLTSVELTMVVQVIQASICTETPGSRHVPGDYSSQVPAFSKEGRGSTDADPRELNPGTVWHHPKWWAL
jgi:hypothetical protein